MCTSVPIPADPKLPPVQAKDTPLHKAATEGHTDTCELLIRHGADVTARDREGRTPSQVADDKDIRRFLKNRGEELIKEKLYHELLQKSGGVKTDRCKVFFFGIAKTGKSTLKISLKRVHRWLSFIKSCNRNRQRDVILVASHADKVSLTSGQRQAAHLLKLMKAEFKDQLRISDEVFLMNCKETRTPEMDRLKKLLAKMKTAMLEHQRQMPKLCNKIIKRLPIWCQTKCSPKCPVLRWPGYVDAVKEIDPHVDEDFLLESTRFLDHLGEIIFKCPTASEPIIVLKPNWLCTDVIGPMMAPVNFPIPRLERTSEDYVTREEIQRVFQDVADVDLLITLLQEFQLCHSYDGQTFIFPGLLTQTMPGQAWRLTQEPKVIYFGKQVQCADTTDMFSSGFFPRVQTRLMREQENRPLLWRDGAKCVDRNVEGLIKLSPDGRAANICVRSVQGDKVQCGKMLLQLENTIADVLDECSPGTGTEEKVLSARALKEHMEEFYSYGSEEISKAAAEGGTIVHPILGFTENVNDLLCREVETPLNRNRPKLVQALRHVEPILDRLLACGILGADEPDRIKAKETPQDKARELLNIVERKGELACREFKAVLEEVNPHAAAMIQDGASDLLREEDDPLVKNRPELVRDLTSSYVLETILNHLLSRGHLSEEECDIIRAKRTSHDKARELLDIVGRKGVTARQVFRKVLEEVSPDLAEIVA
ncbi:death-associated protein kinase 1-like isoform X2 [Branchiostoma floridae x Branchiostoma belcheri]